MAVVEHELHAPSVGVPAGRPQVQIVPVRALPVVAVAVALLIAAIATNSPWALTFFHVAAAGSGRRSTSSSASSSVRSSAGCRFRPGSS